MRKSVTVICLTTLGFSSGCQDAIEEQVNDATAAQVATLYRNGSLDKTMRLHFTSFDVKGEANNFNINNCEMAARLLNANVAEQWRAQGLPDVGFWCEPGPYREDGLAPAAFDAEYPTNVQGYAAP